MKRLLAVVALLGCAGPTGYAPPQSWSPEYGYRDKQLGALEFSVSAGGNAQTSAERVAEIALLRAAHVTIEQGKRFFVIDRKKNAGPATSHTGMTPIFISGTMVPVPMPDNVRHPNEPMAAIILDIVEPETPGAIDARAVITQIGPHF